MSGSLSVYDVLFMLVSMVEGWLFLVAWLGSVILFKVMVSLVCRGVAVVDDVGVCWRVVQVGVDGVVIDVGWQAV